MGRRNDSAKKGKAEPGVQPTQPGSLPDLPTGEAERILEILLHRHPELRSEVEQFVAQPAVTPSVSSAEIATEVFARVAGIDLESLNERAGSHAWGYVAPSEAAWELLDEEFEDVQEELQRQIEAGERSEALETCIGVVLGLYRARDASSDGALGWAPDWPLDKAEDIIVAYLRSLDEDTRASHGVDLSQTFQQAAPEWAGFLQRIVDRVMKP